jgi:DNA-binding SARP family transcriptional activator/WD40 repeat protein
MTDQLEFRVLGPLEIVADGRSIEVDAPKQRAILAMLLIHANDVVSIDQLQEVVWGDKASDRSVSTLRYHVFKLREVLPGDAVVTRSPGYLLEVGPDAVDQIRFEELVAEARRDLVTDRARALELFDEALGLWRGTPYADFSYEEFAHLESERLEEIHRGALEERLEILLAMGRHQELLPELEKLTAEYPTRERLWGHLALALYRSGRQAEAVAAVQQVRSQLGDVGLDLSPHLKELEDRILTQDALLLTEVSAPERLRGYVIRGRIGEGAHGVVWRAAQPGVGREVAIKAIRPELANQPAFIRRFEAEAQLVAALEHPHIVSLFDFWRDPDGAYLVMPYLRGGSLSDLLEREPLESTAALQLLEDIGAALTYAHRRGVVHRDVTPHNVLLDDDDNAYLADFGVATLLGEAAAQYAKDTPSAAYISPELLAGERVTPASDVFSLGALAKAMLTNGASSETVGEVLGRAMVTSPEDRYESIDEFLGALSDAVGGSTEPVPVRLELRNPYKGLRAFGEADAPDFFGRDRLVAELVDVVGRHRLVGVVGPSGCGKSSLVRAGLIPKLRRGALPGSERWLITDMYPGVRPFAELESALLRVAIDRPADLEARLINGDWEGLIGGLLPRDGELLLLVDQFEELFTVTGSDEERRSFLDALVGLAADPRHRVRVVVTMRADFYDRPLEFPEFAELMRSGLVSVAMPGRESMIDAVVEPARTEGLEIEAGLAAAIVGDVADQPGGLPLLEYALTELFRHRDGNRLSGDGYRRTGGVLGALGTRAEELYQRQEGSGREAVRQVFLRLVNVAEGVEHTRRRIPLGELHSLGIDGDVLEPVLDAFAAHRLLTFDRDPKTREPTVEVAHEALLDRWDRLRTWIDDRRDDLVLHRRLAASLAEWQASDQQTEYLLTGGRLDHYETFIADTDLAISRKETIYLADSRRHSDELAARRRRRRRSVMAGFATAAVIAAVLAVAAFVAQQRAEREALSARARDLASSAVLAAESDPLLAMNLAVLAVETLPEGEDPGPALDTALRTAKAADQSAGRYEFDPSLWTLADVSPDGSTVAAVDWQQLVVLDSATMEEIWSQREPGPDAFGDVVYSSDGEFIVASVFDERSTSHFGSEASDADGVPDPRLLVFDAGSGELVHVHPVELEGACQAYPSWRSDLGLLGLGVEGCRWDGIAVQFVDTATWELVYQHPTAPNDIAGVGFAREGTLAAMFSGFNYGSESWLIDTVDWSIVREIDYPVGDLSPDGKMIAGYDTGEFRVVLEDSVSGDPIDRFPTDDAIAVGIRFSPMGDVLAIGTSADTTLLFDVETGELIDTIQPASVVTIALGDNYLYVAGAGVVSKWDTTGIGQGDLNTVPLGLWVERNSIWWTLDGTVVADVLDHATGEWSLYPVDSSTGDLREPFPYGYGAWGISPITDNRVVMFRGGLADSDSEVYEYGPLEVADLSTGESTVVAGCWMEELAALAHEPCPNGDPHPAGQIPYQASRDGTEFMILDLQETEAGENEVFASIWDTSTFTETSRLSLGVQEGIYYYNSLLTEDYIVLHGGRSHPIQVHDRVTGEELLEVAASGNFSEHDRAQNRIWVTDGFDTTVSLLDLDTFEFRPVTGHVADSVRGLATSPSGELVAAASGDGFVRIYTDEGDLRHSIPLPNPSDAWWLDEETLVVGTGNGPWTVVTLDPDRLLGAVKASLRRGFTDDECSLYEIEPCPTLEELRGG